MSELSSCPSLPRIGSMHFSRDFGQRLQSMYRRLWRNGSWESVVVFRLPYWISRTILFRIPDIQKWQDQDGNVTQKMQAAVPKLLKGAGSTFPLPKCRNGWRQAEFRAFHHKASPTQLPWLFTPCFAEWQPILSNFYTIHLCFHVSYISNVLGRHVFQQVQAGYQDASLWTYQDFWGTRTMGQRAW